jgi:hypothetical protein
MRGLLTNHGRLARWMPAPRSLAGYAMTVVGRLRDLAPYAMMELLILPGGSLMAVLLWLYRRQNKAPEFATQEILSEYKAELEFGG